MSLNKYMCKARVYRSLQKYTLQITARKNRINLNYIFFNLLFAINHQVHKITCLSETENRNFVRRKNMKKIGNFFLHAFQNITLLPRQKNK